MGTLKDDLVATRRELRETHISWVFLDDERALKVKKPVALGFLDFSTLRARRAACEAELSLNRRLAPDVYRRLVPVTCDATGRHALDGEGAVVDWAVEMRRLSDGDAADARLAAGTLVRADIARIAEHVAGFHAAARADADTARFGEPAAIRHNVVENFAQTRESATRYLDPASLAEIERAQLGFLDRHEGLFERRVRTGRVREGHGDLRLEHVYLDDAGHIEIIDCIEFNERFRHGDVCADVAFLSMDLTWHDAPSLSEAFLAAYVRASGDWDLYALVDFYASYRAFVRGKVSLFLADDAGAAPELRERAARDARKYFLLAQACEREPLSRPVLYAVAGLVASGKSTLADALADAVDAPVVSSDRTRKELAGVEPTQKLAGGTFTGAYTPAQTEKVYAELARRAGIVLDSGRSVIVDASFRSRALRDFVRTLARKRGVELRLVECRVPAEVARARLAERARGPSVSDAGIDAYEALTRRWEAIDELAPGEHMRVDTTGPTGDAVARIAESGRSAGHGPSPNARHAAHGLATGPTGAR